MNIKEAKAIAFGSKPSGKTSGEIIPHRVEAATRAKEYSKMSKAEMNSAYDDLRKSDPAKAAIEGKKMHRAFFNK